MRYSITQFTKDFPNDDACLAWLVSNYHPEGIICKNCNKVTKHHKIRSRKSYSCDACGNHFHPTAGTIFHKSSTPLTLWFRAIYLMSVTRSGVSAKHLERELGVTYKTAWRMFHQIRKMMEDDEPLDGEVEIDEAYIHPNTAKRSSAKPHESKTILGMTERGGRVIAKHVKSSGSRVLGPAIDKYVSKDSIIFTDTHGSYKQLTKKGYTHVTINHSAGEYVKGNIHTQNIENFWSNLKRGIHGVYRGVGKEHLQNYINEYAWRYSHRTDTRPLFLTLLETVSS